MATTASHSEQSRDNSRLFYCHSCRSQFVKPRDVDSVFECPRCRLGFIEEVDGDFQPNPITFIAPPTTTPFLDFTFFNDIIALSSRTQRARSTRGRSNANNNNSRSQSRSRSPSHQSPHVSIVVESINGNQEASPGTNYRIGFNHHSGANRFLSVAIDDIMRHAFMPSERLPIMTETQLKEIPEATVSEKQIEDQLSCTVCFEDFSMNEKEVRKLVCNHLFHEKCIFPWLRYNANCPICRTQQPNATQAVNTTSNGDEDIASFLRIIQRRSRNNNNNNNSSANNVGPSTSEAQSSASTINRAPLVLNTPEPRTRAQRESLRSILREDDDFERTYSRLNQIRNNLSQEIEGLNRLERSFNEGALTSSTSSSSSSNSSSEQQPTSAAPPEIVETRNNVRGARIRAISRIQRFIEAENAPDFDPSMEEEEDEDEEEQSSPPTPPTSRTTDRVRLERRIADFNAAASEIHSARVRRIARIRAQMRNRTDNDTRNTLIQTARMPSYLPRPIRLVQPTIQNNGASSNLPIQSLASRSLAAAARTLARASGTSAGAARTLARASGTVASALGTARTALLNGPNRLSPRTRGISRVNSPRLTRAVRSTANVQMETVPLPFPARVIPHVERVRATRRPVRHENRSNTNVTSTRRNFAADDNDSDSVTSPPARQRRRIYSSSSDD